MGEYVLKHLLHVVQLDLVFLAIVYLCRAWLRERWIDRCLDSLAGTDTADAR
jgi:hypothetical protein